MFVGRFEYGVEAFKDFPMLVFQQSLFTIYYGRQSRVEHIEQRLVVFVHEHYGPSAVFLVGLCQNINKSVPQGRLYRVFSIFRFPRRYSAFYLLRQYPRWGEIIPIEVEMKYRIFQPVLFQVLHGQSLEQLFFTQEVVLKGRHQQALSEAARTAEEINSSFRHETMDECGLVYIDKITCDNLLEVLYSNRVFHDISNYG